jgi:hypothetical protein
VVVGGVDGGGAPLSLSASARQRVETASTGKLRLFSVQEVDLAWMSGGPPAPADWYVLRPTSRSPVPPPSPPVLERVVLLAHRGGTGSPSDLNLPAWTALARTAGASVEVGPGNERLDSNGARQAREAGLSLVLPTGVSEPVDSPTGPVALKFARRAGTLSAEVRNADAHAPFSGGRKGGRG